MGRHKTATPRLLTVHRVRLCRWSKADPRGPRRRSDHWRRHLWAGRGTTPSDSRLVSVIATRGPLLGVARRQRWRLGGRKGKSPPYERWRCPVRVARAPEKRAPGLAEQVKCPHEREIAERFFFQADACRELIE